MSFIFMVLHWPELGREQELARAMNEMRAALTELPGCAGVDPPHITDDGTCLVGISRWETKDDFLASGITLGPSDQIVDGEIRPRQRLLLSEAPL